MTNRIRIITIGSPGSGKTCFLYAMYAKMAFGINGFTFMPSDYDQGLDLEKGWECIVHKSAWPGGTDLTTKYEFECSYSYEPITTFDWLDYRGRIWEEQDSPDRRELLENLGGADALFIFIKAESIKDILTNVSGGDKDFRTISKLVQEFRRKKSPVPVSLIITKADLIPEVDIENGILKFKEECLEPLFLEGGGWPVMITAVAIGDELSGKQGEEIKGKIEPRNIHLPAMFAIYNRLIQILDSDLEDAEQYESEKSSAHIKYTQESGKNWWKRVWTGDQSKAYHQALVEAEKKIKEKRGLIERLEKEIVKIENELRQNCVVYFDGVRREFV